MESHGAEVAWTVANLLPSYTLLSMNIQSNTNLGYDRSIAARNNQNHIFLA